MAAPSGKFCRPMPSARAKAPVYRAGSSPCWAARAKEKPTAMPSGMLCSVTARTSRVVRFQEEECPSGWSAPRCRWGITESRAMRKPTPRRKPPAAGSQPGTPWLSASSMAGISRLHTEAATITPAAKPRKIRWAPSVTRLRKKKTIEAPRTVIKQVKPVPAAAHSTGCIPTPPHFWLC